MIRAERLFLAPCLVGDHPPARAGRCRAERIGARRVLQHRLVSAPAADARAAVDRA